MENENNLEKNYQEDIKEISIVKEMESSFIDYAMSVIVSRAIPDARDGLKPVHRRILYAMYGLDMNYSKSFKKSARAVGEVIAKYHPHGDSAVYDSLVRMAQTFSLRYPLVKGQGNFGSIDGDSAAAMRYTEAKLAKISNLMLEDINKQTVDFQENYDGSETEPTVLPSKIPNLLLNGSTGIAVGMATSIPPHNINEILNGAILLLNDKEIEIHNLLDIISGPDFPTGGIIVNKNDLLNVYQTGRGRIVIRSKVEINEAKDEAIVTEIPYMINKSLLIERIAELVKNGQISSISDLRDESNREGIRIVIKFKKYADVKVEVNKLYKLTQLQSSFAVNLLALKNSRPKLFNLKELLEIYIDHQLEVLLKKAKFLLKKALDRLEILEALKKALSNIDNVIKKIKASKTTDIAINNLINLLKINNNQAKAILEMRLQRLTGLEISNLNQEFTRINLEIKNLEEIISSKDRQKQELIKLFNEIKEKYGDKRLTKISLEDYTTITDENLIEQKDIIITLSNKGYIKRLEVDEYNLQKRGGIGSRGAKTSDNDFISTIIFANTHLDLLFFTSFGKVYRLKGYEVRKYSKNAKGIPIVNIIKNIDDHNGERVEDIVAIKDYQKYDFIFFTKNGLIKKTSADEFTRININGKKALKLTEKDRLIGVTKIPKNEIIDIIIGNQAGKAVRFKSNQIRTMGRVTQGVKGIDSSGGNVVGFATSNNGNLILSISERGFSKLTNLNEYRLTKRAAKGVKTLNIEKAGRLIGLKTVLGNEDLMIIKDDGTIIRTNVSNISQSGRNTKGVTTIKLREENKITGITIVRDIEDNILEENKAVKVQN
ncbi:DNA gyrase subunit A [Candidatus Hepatoplasma crinochetorum Av]|uniref:DNA topoisomerase (ATP-hydrolyzing) n=1 Tax=Candidatus Hepatoplasma crinochetorum Av TaxID=1427984 RepID=W8GTE3_9MOLU|nr:DNA gyrase subunit A [Candidatus Hepatoplasma crinochetorum]AHK22700.1 DNA gyrase subunit A [Candidatus Hepatoplasma crinochetorum Av]